MKTLLNSFYIALISLYFTPALAETIKIPGHVESNIQLELPKRGDTMDNIRFKFGNPNKELFPVGNPPITQWQYEGFNVYFEHQHVIHAINLDTLIMPNYN